MTPPLPEKLSLLLIDPDDESRDLFPRIFKRQYAITAVADEASARDLLSSQSFGILVANQKLPDLNGVSFFQSVKVLAPYALKILISGDYNIDEIFAGITSGDVHKYIKRPWFPEEIPKAIEEVQVYQRLYLHNQSLVEELRQHNQRLVDNERILEEKVISRTQELADTIRELRTTQAQLVLSAKLASLWQLVSGMAHELNNPINAIKANLDFLAEFAEKYATSNGDNTSLSNDFPVEDISGAIGDAQRSSEKIATLVRDLKRFAKLDEAEHKLTNINEDIQNTAKILASALGERLTIRFDLQPLPLIYAYPKHLNHVFFNLIRNALDAVIERGELRIATSCNERHVSIRFIDNGRGIPASVLPNIFDPFFTTKPVGSGVGLGLATCHSVIQMHGGQIAVDSEVGRGTTVEVTLPRREA